MKLIQKEVLLHGGRTFHILTPEIKCRDIIATDDNKGYYCIFSNGTGYSQLMEVFSLAGSLQENELIYLPLDFAHKEALEKDFLGMDNYCDGIILFNYCTTQLNNKDIILLLKNQAVGEKTITRNDSFSDDYPGRWKLHRRLTVKKKGKILIISGNSDIFTMLAQTCWKYEGENNSRYNYSHRHHDWDENTAKSLGITFYYWQESKGGD